MTAPLRPGRSARALRPLLRLSTFLAFMVALTYPVDGAGQERPDFEVQLAPDDADHPVGSVFIERLDSIWTAAGSVIPDGSILIRDGIIEAVGPDLQAPDGIRVIDGSGLTAIPGIVDEHSHTAMSATNEGTGAVVPEVRVYDVLDPEDFAIYQALSGGVTTARVMHGSANPIGGQSAVIKMRWNMEDRRQLLLPGAPRSVKFALGENVTQKNFARTPRRFPASRPGVEAVYAEAFTAALEYAAEWQAYRENPEAYRVPPRRDLRLEALVDIMEGRIRVHAHSYRADEILMLMRVAERFGFRIDVFTHVLEGYKVAEEMAAHGAAAATFSDWWQYKLEAIDAIPHNAALLHRAGVLTALNSDIPWLQSFMTHEIAKPVKYGGLPREESLRMLTLYPARMMYIDDMVGSLEEGKHGDVVLLSGDPFDAYTRVQKTIVDGIVYYDLDDEAGTRDEPFLPAPGLAPGGEAGEGVGAGGRPASAGRGEGASTVTGSAVPDEPLLETRSFALTGATLHPVASPPVEDGIVVVRNGRITAVGPRSAIGVPGDLPVVDVSGRHLYPGMIDAMTILGLYEFGQSANASDLSETGRYNPHVRAIDGVQMEEPGIAVARANGITAAFTAQASGIVQGTGAVIQLAGDDWADAAVAAEAALVVDFPAPETPWDERDEESAREKAPGRADSVPTLEDERLEELVALFRRSGLYVDSATVRPDPTEPFWPNREPPDRALLEGMTPAVRGDIPVFFRVETEWQMRTLFVFLDEFPDVRAVVVGGVEAGLVADELARRGIPVVLTSAYSPTPNRDHSVTAAYRTAALLERAGVPFAFGTLAEAENGLARNLPYHAAHSVAFGLTREAGLRAVTLGAAEILGVDPVTGSLESGKRADFILTDGDPLQMLTRIHRMWIGGVEVDPRDNRHQRLYEEHRDAP